MRDIASYSVDLVVADPPYNLGKDYGDRSDSMGHHTFIEFTLEWLTEAIRILKPRGSIYVFMGYQYISNLFLMMKGEGLIFNSWITWYFTQGVGRTRGFSPRHEDILFFTKTNDYKFFVNEIRVPQKAMRSVNNSGDVWSVPHVHHNKVEKEDHPTQKPEEVIRRIVTASSSECDLVVDPFSGSGTTARVCKDMNRQFIGFETNKEFFDNSYHRLTRI